MESGLARRRARTRGDILRAARELLLQGGVSALSLRQVAKLADYSPAGLYEYFDGIHGIVDAVARDGFDQLEAYLRRVPATLDPAGRLLALCEQYLAFAREQPGVFQLIFSTLPPPETRWSQLLKRPTAYKLLGDTVRDGIDDGSFAVGVGYGVEEISYHAWATVHGMALLRLTYLSRLPRSLERQQRRILERMLMGLRRKSR